MPVLEDSVLIEWLRDAAPRCAWTASVCTGAGLYAVAGLLDGESTSTHLGFRDYLKALGVKVVPDRVVWEGTHVSAAGVSAGIDMALSLSDPSTAATSPRPLQLIIEYDPEPPFDAGSPAKAGARTQRQRRMMLGDRPVRAGARFGRELVPARMRRVRGARSERSAAAHRATSL